MLKAIAMRGVLKSLVKSGRAAEIILGQIAILARVKKVNLLTAEIDYLSDDVETVLQTGTLYIGTVTEIRTLPVELVRLNLMRQNPELALEDSWSHFYGAHPSELCDEEEEDE